MPLTKKDIFDGLKEYKTGKLKPLPPPVKATPPPTNLPVEQPGVVSQTLSKEADIIRQSPANFVRGVSYSAKQTPGAVKEFGQIMSQTPGNIGKGLEYVGGGIGDILGRIVGGITGFLLGGLSGKDRAGAIEQAKISSKETGQFGRQTVGNALSFLPTAIQTGIDITPKAAKVAIGREDDFINYVATKLQEQVPNMSSEQARNYLISGNLEGDQAKYDGKEVGKAWFAALLPVGFDLSIVSGLGTSALKNYYVKNPTKGYKPVSNLKVDFDKGLAEATTRYGKEVRDIPIQPGMGTYERTIGLPTVGRVLNTPLGSGITKPIAIGEFTPTPTRVETPTPTPPVAPTQLEPTPGREPTLARPQLPEGTSVKPVIPTTTSPQVAFNIVNPKNLSLVKSLQDKLSKVIAVKEDLMKKGKATPKTIQEVKGLREMISSLEDQINVVRAGAIKVSGPVVEGRQPTAPSVALPTPQIEPTTSPTQPVKKYKSADKAEKAITEKPSKLYHGTVEGKMKIDRYGNINLSTEPQLQFGTPTSIDTKGLKIVNLPTKAELFDAALNKERYVNNDVDILMSGNHAIAIRPYVLAKKTGFPVINYTRQTVGGQAEIARPKLPKGRQPKVISEETLVKRGLIKKGIVAREAAETTAKYKEKISAEEKALKEREQARALEAKQILEEARRTASSKAVTRKMTPEEMERYGIKPEKQASQVEKLNVKDYKNKLVEMKQRGLGIEDFEKLYMEEFNKESESDKALEIGKSDIILEFIEDNFARKMTTAEKLAYEEGTLESTRQRRTSDFVNKYEGEAQATGEDFILSKKVEDVLNYFGIKYGERELKRTQMGVYKPLSDKVRVRALQDVSTVVHEVTHRINRQYGITDKIGLIENPTLIALKDVYLKSYPKAKPKDPEAKQLTEGLSVFIENYFYDPAGMEKQYPQLVNSIIKPTGRYYNPDITTLLEKVNSIVDEYSRLSAEERIGAHIKRGNEVVQSKSGFNISQRLIFEAFNRFEPLSRYAKKQGVRNTWDDPTVQAFNWMNKNNFVAQWIFGKTTPIIKPDGNFEFPDGSMETYIKMIGGKEKEFDTFLVARRVVADHNKLTLLHETQKKLQTQLESATDKADIKNINKQLDVVNQELNDILDIIENDDFRLQDAMAVIAEYLPNFEKPSKLYDEINQRLLQWSYNTGLITKENFKQWSDEVGYTSFRRYINDELTAGNVGTVTTSSKAKVSSFKARKGSGLDIVSPVFNQRVAISEIIGKGLENMLWEKVYNLSKANPEIAARFEEIEPKIAISRNGTITYPQERDPNIIRIFIAGKRRFFKAAPEFIAVVKSMRDTEITAFDVFLRLPSSIFTRLTTSANPFFMLGNISIDQFSRLLQTRTGYNIIDTPKGLVEFIKKTDEMNQYLSLGGRRQTLASFYDLSPEQFAHKLSGGEKTISEKIIDVVDSAIGLAEIPSNSSEISTRYGEYAKALKEGKSQSESMYLASDVTTPFQLTGNIFGSTGRSWLRSIPYLNAGLQVLYKQARATAENPKRMGTVYAALLATALTTVLAIIKSSSEEQKRELKNLKIYDLTTGIFVPSPTGKGLIKIKIPQTVGALTGIAQLYVISQYDGNKAKMDEYFEAVTSMLPPTLNIARPSTIPINLTPQALKPSIETTFNTRTFPEIMPIVPDYMKQLPPDEQYTSYTSRVAKFYGQILNISPAKIDFFIREQFGVVGAFMLGDLPSFPLWKQEEKYKLSGRAFDIFYEQYQIVQQQTKESKKEDTAYSPQEQININLLNGLYTNVNDILSIQRDILNKKVPLSEEVKQITFDVLVSLDDLALSDYGTINKTKQIMDKFQDLQLKLRDVMGEIYSKQAEQLSKEALERFKKK